jgi:hypothetical protein
VSFDQCRNGGCENGSITAIAINTADGGRWRPERSSCASLWSAASADTKDGHTTSVSLFSTGQNDESDESAPVVPRYLLSCTWHVTSKINHLPRWKLPTDDSSSDSIPGTLAIIDILGRISILLAPTATSWAPLQVLFWSREHRAKRADANPPESRAVGDTLDD